MSRLMSVAMTTDAVIERRKDVTRRLGWWKDYRGARLLVPGDTVTLCEKVQGRQGKPLVRLAEVEAVDVRREPLNLLLTDPEYGRREVEREGFPGMDPEEFITRFFIEAQKVSVDQLVTRIEWRYIESCKACSEPAPAAHTPCCSSHGKPLCCEHYCRYHFVEVNQCTPKSHRRAS